VFHRSTHRLGTPLPWWQASAPPHLRQALVTYVLMVIPAIAGVIWQWPWLLTLGLIVPGLLAHEILGYKSAQARGIHLREEVPASARMTILAVVVGFVGVSVATSGPKYATPLEMVIGLLIFVEPVWRLGWRRHAQKPQSHIPR